MDGVGPLSPTFSLTTPQVSSAMSEKARSVPKEIAHAAGEFESMLLNQWLQGAESSFGSVPGGNDDQDAGDEQMKSFANQMLAKGFTASGGIGLSAMVAKALSSGSSVSRESPAEAK